MMCVHLWQRRPLLCLHGLVCLVQLGYSWNPSPVTWLVSPTRVDLAIQPLRSWRTPSLLDMVLVASTTLLQELTGRGTWPISKDKLVFRPGDELVCAASLTLSLGSGCAC